MKQGIDWLSVANTNHAEFCISKFCELDCSFMWAGVSWSPWLHLVPFMREGLITILWGMLFQAFVKYIFMEDFVAPSKSPVYCSWLGLNNCMVIQISSIEVQTVLIRYITSQMHDIGFWAPLKNGRVVLHILNRQTYIDFQFLCWVNFYANLEFILWVIYQYPADTDLNAFGAPRTLKTLDGSLLVVMGQRVCSAQSRQTPCAPQSPTV